MKTKKKVTQTMYLESAEKNMNGFYYTYYSSEYIDKRINHEVSFVSKKPITSVKEFCELNNISEENAINILKCKL